MFYLFNLAFSSFMPIYILFYFGLILSYLQKIKVKKEWKKSVVYDKKNPGIFTLIFSPSLRWHISIQHRIARTCHLGVEGLATSFSIAYKHLSATQEFLWLECCGRWCNMSIWYDNDGNIMVQNCYPFFVCLCSIFQNFPHSIGITDQ